MLLSNLQEVNSGMIKEHIYPKNIRHFYHKLISDNKK